MKWIVLWQNLSNGLLQSCYPVKKGSTSAVLASDDGAVQFDQSVTGFTRPAGYQKAEKAGTTIEIGLL